MDGFGMPKLWGAIPLLGALDAAFTAFKSDLDEAEKITLINEMLCSFTDNGDPITPNEQLKRRFVLMGEKLPDQEELVHEITPTIRVKEFRESIELLLGMLSRMYGYGMRRYTLATTSNEMTARQYTGERLDMLQELNRQRFAAKTYIEDIIQAIIWFTNTYQGASYAAAEINIAFDDNWIQDAETTLQYMRQDVIDHVGGKNVLIQYLMKRYNLNETEARKWAEDSEIEEGKGDTYGTGTAGTDPGTDTEPGDGTGTDGTGTEGPDRTVHAEDRRAPEQ